jgi:hypothetical protein
MPQTNIDWREPRLGMQRDHKQYVHIFQKENQIPSNETISYTIPEGWKDRQMKDLVNVLERK